METVDKQKAARVWQRVQGQEPKQLDPNGLLALIAGELADSATYLQLSRRFQGQQSITLRKLYEQEQSHAACLKGIYTLLTGERLISHTPTAFQEPLSATLRRCYGREMRSLKEYEARSGDPEYGHVFARLADQERAHCRAVLELIGALR